MLKPWLVERWCISKPDGAYLACMEDVLDLYEQATDPRCPRLVFEERPCQLLDDVREPLPLQVGSARKVDDEYERCGTCTLFLAYDLDSGQRYVQVRAHQLKKLLHFHFTPKHGSWLNLAEIELSVLVRQCLDRRLPSQQAVETEALAWTTRRNAAGFALSGALRPLSLVPNSSAIIPLSILIIKRSNH